MTPEEMKNELRYLRAENAYLKAMQEHLPGKKSAGSWRKNESHPEPEVRTLPV